MRRDDLMRDVKRGIDEALQTNARYEIVPFWHAANRAFAFRVKVNRRIVTVPEELRLLPQEDAEQHAGGWGGAATERTRAIIEYLERQAKEPGRRGTRRTV